MDIAAEVSTLKLTLFFPIMESHSRSIGSAGGAFYQANQKAPKLDLVVVRVNKSGNPCNARPCHNCLDMMKAVGIRKVYYSINQEEIICENVKDMISIQASSVAKHIAKLNGDCTVDDPDKFYESLLHKYFPKIVRKHNLESFIAYNFTNVLPTYRAVLNSKEEFTLVIIYDSKNNIVTTANVVP